MNQVHQKSFTLLKSNFLEHLAAFIKTCFESCKLVENLSHRQTHYVFPPRWNNDQPEMPKFDNL